MKVDENLNVLRVTLVISYVKFGPNIAHARYLPSSLSTYGLDQFLERGLA